MLMWTHPVLQVLGLCISFYVLYLGWVRFCSAHLGRKDLVFAWQAHVRQGTAVLTTWALAFVVGLGATWVGWNSVFITDKHYQVALVMLPLLFFGLGSGMYMDRVKARRRLLPLAHGLCNALLVLLALCQLYTGVMVLRNMVIG